MKRVEGRAQTSNFKALIEFLTKIKDYVNFENQDLRTEKNLTRTVDPFVNDQQPADDMEGVEGMEDDDV